jgi:hypothetical protein
VYSIDHRTGHPVHNLYNDYDDLYLYSGEAALLMFREYTDAYAESWKIYGEKRVYPTDVCQMCALLVPVLDDVPLPDDANELFRYETRYLDGADPEDIIPEHEFPLAEPFRTLWEDGKISCGEILAYDPLGYIARWKAAGWDGGVTEV